MPDKIFRELAARLGRALSDYQASVDDFDRETARLLGVNSTDLRCLEVLLRETGEASPGRLAERLGLTTGAVTTMLDRLERLGYVERAPHPSDRRRTVVRATPAVTARAQELIAPLVSEGERMLAKRYTADELQLIVDFVLGVDELQRRHVARLREIEIS